MLCFVSYSYLVMDVWARFGKNHLELVLSPTGSPDHQNHCARKRPIWLSFRLDALVRVTNSSQMENIKNSVYKKRSKTV